MALAPANSDNEKFNFHRCVNLFDTKLDKKKTSRNDCSFCANGLGISFVISGDLDNSISGASFVLILSLVEMKD